MLAGQAKAVEDLDFLVREELRVGRQFTESMAQAGDHALETQVADQLADCIAEQGRAITDLRDVVEDIGSRVKQQTSLSAVPASPGKPAAVASDIVERVGMLEEQTASIQRHLVMIVSAVRQIRDHASDALDDRMVAAMGEVHRRLAGSIASIHTQVRKLSTDEEAAESISAGRYQEGMATNRSSSPPCTFVLGS